MSAVVVDWADVPFLTLAGVAVLEDFREGRGRSNAGSRSAWWPRTECRAVLRIVGLDDVLAIHDTVEQALAGGKASGEGRGRPEIGKTS
ncbi:hypothetical protein AB0E78_08615 [Streptomyces sp. NPDC032198]|uniref:hypothetical protein n=1 Tax=Streptomyces sp. NPDC032198 TaxID=3155127 RepID=UPI0033E53302